MPSTLTRMPYNGLFYLDKVIAGLYPPIPVGLGCIQPDTGELIVNGQLTRSGFIPDFFFINGSTVRSPETKNAWQE